MIVAHVFCSFFPMHSNTNPGLFYVQQMRFSAFILGLACLRHGRSSMLANPNNEHCI